MQILEVSGELYNFTDESLATNLVNSRAHVESWVPFEQLKLIP